MRGVTPRVRYRAVDRELTNRACFLQTVNLKENVSEYDMGVGNPVVRFFFFIYSTVAILGHLILNYPSSL